MTYSFDPHLAELCLHFANTVGWHASSQPQEKLGSYDDLLSWARQHALLTADEADELHKTAQRAPRKARETLQEAITFREAVFRTFSARTHKQTVAPLDLGLINDMYVRAVTNSWLVETDGVFDWTWTTDDITLDRMLWLVARSAIGLLTTPELLTRVGECADDRGCGWLFLDLSKNRTRRWCDINDCGNRAKQRRHYQKIKGQR